MVLLKNASRFPKSNQRYAQFGERKSFIETFIRHALHLCDAVLNDYTTVFHKCKNNGIDAMIKDAKYLCVQLRSEVSVCKCINRKDPMKIVELTECLKLSSEKDLSKLVHKKAIT